MEMPHNSTLGLRVSRTTMSTGTKKMRSNVSELGRFMCDQRRKWLFWVAATPRLTIDSAKGGVNGRDLEESRYVMVNRGVMARMLIKNTQCNEQGANLCKCWN